MKLHLTEDQKRILELEQGLKDVLHMRNIETIKTHVAGLVGEEPDDYIDDEDFLDYDDDLNFEEDDSRREW